MEKYCVLIDNTVLSVSRGTVCQTVRYDSDWECSFSYTIDIIIHGLNTILGVKEIKDGRKDCKEAKFPPLQLGKTLRNRIKEFEFLKLKEILGEYFRV